MDPKFQKTKVAEKTSFFRRISVVNEFSMAWSLQKPFWSNKYCEGFLDKVLKQMFEYFEQNKIWKIILDSDVVEKTIRINSESK